MNRTVEELTDKIIEEYECPKCGYRDKHIRHHRPRKISPWPIPYTPPIYSRWIILGEPTENVLKFWRKW